MSWQTRVLVHLDALAHHLGNKAHWRLFCAVMNLERDKVPRFEGPCEVRKSGEFDKATGLEIGNMFCDVIIENGLHAERHSKQFLMTTLRYRDEFRKIADACKLNDEERKELFTELVKFIGKDERVKTYLGGNLEEI